MPLRIEWLFFDFDSTLYTHVEFARFQNDVLISYLAQHRGESEAKTREALVATGAKSLSNQFLALGISIADSVAWRKELIDPRYFLKYDVQLVRTIDTLSKLYNIALITNNPHSIALTGIEVLGVKDYFKFIVGLDDTHKSKPSPEPFLQALALAKCPNENVLSIGDREAVDIAPALALGMGAILVDGVKDVYRLVGVLGRGERVGGDLSSLNFN